MTNEAISIAITELEAVEREIGIPSKAVPLLRTMLTDEPPGVQPFAYWDSEEGTLIRAERLGPYPYPMPGSKWVPLYRHEPCAITKEKYAERASAWETVAERMLRSNPNLFAYDGTGIEAAIAELDRLYAHAPPPEVGVREAAQDLIDTLALGPLGAAAKYGPDVDVREIEIAAIEALQRALAVPTKVVSP